MIGKVTVLFLRAFSEGLAAALCKRCISYCQLRRTLCSGLVDGIVCYHSGSLSLLLSLSLLQFHDPLKPVCRM